MAATLPMYLSPVVVVAGYNDDIAGHDGTSAIVATLDPGTYYITGDDSATDLLYEIETQLNTQSGTNATWAVSIASGIISVSCNTGGSAWYLDLDNSGSGVNLFDGLILGASSTATAFGAADNTAEAFPNQHKYGWYATQALSEDSKNTRTCHASRHEAGGGTQSTVRHGSIGGIRTVTHYLETLAKSYPQTATPNQSWLDFWATANSGQNIRFYLDQTDTSTYFDCVLDAGSASDAKPQRLSPAMDLYTWSVTMREKL